MKWLTSKGFLGGILTMAVGAVRVVGGAQNGEVDTEGVGMMTGGLALLGVRMAQPKPGTKPKPGAK